VFSVSSVVQSQKFVRRIAAVNIHVRGWAVVNRPHANAVGLAS